MEWARFQSANFKRAEELTRNVSMTHLVWGDAERNAMYPNRAGWHYVIYSYHHAVYIAETWDTLSLRIWRKCCSVYYTTVVKNNHGTNKRLLYMAIRCALYRNTGYVQCSALIISLWKQGVNKLYGSDVAQNSWPPTVTQVIGMGTEWRWTKQHGKRTTQNGVSRKRICTWVKNKPKRYIIWSAKCRT